MVPTTADLTSLYGSLSAAEATSLDRAAEAAGIAVAQLMEIAGFQVARCAHALAADAGRARALVIAGSGNNGGDGLVAARHLAAWGWAVSVHAVADAATWRLGHLAAPFDGLGVEFSTDASGEAAVAALRGAGDALIVDALLGTGLNAAPRPAHAAVIAAMTGAAILSVDVPSGLDATTGDSYGAVVTATRTCTLAAMKRGLWTDAGGGTAGDVWVADIGMPAAAWRSAGLEAPELIRGGALLAVPT